MELAGQLKAKREERGLSQEEVARAIFVSRQTISNWENDRTYPDVQSLVLLGQLFGTSIDELVRGDVAVMQRVIEADSRRMRLMGWGMAAATILAFAFLIAFSLAWQEPSGIGRLSKGNIAGIAVFIPFYLGGLASAIGASRLKKKHDIVTYREVEAFLDGRLAEGEDRPGFSREHPALGITVKVLGGAIVGLALISPLLILGA